MFLQYNDQAADLTSTLQMSGSGQLVGDNVIVVNEGADDDDDEHVVVDEQHVVVSTRTSHRRDSAVVFEYVPVDVEVSGAACAPEHVCVRAGRKFTRRIAVGERDKQCGGACACGEVVKDTVRRVRDTARNA
jgi:hypothetical protein